MATRNNVYIDAVRSIGSSNVRILFRHILPNVMAPIIVIFSIAMGGVIIAEAALSFLGLGDPSLPTWGQILERGFQTGAIFLGYWWWIIPPGLLIVVTALCFVFIAQGLEPVVNPRLRRMR